MKKKEKSKKAFIIITVVAALIVAGYAAQGIYYNYTGAIRSEYIFKTEADDEINVSGFVIRDEVKKSDGVNTAVLTKKSEGVYSPVVSDAQSVAADEKIAYIFSSKEDAENYERSAELDDKIDQLKLLQNNKNLDYLDVSTLNLEILSAVNEYMDAVDSNNILQTDELIEKINYKITSKQLITGTNIDFTKEISALKAQKKQLDSSSKKKSVKAPFPGYFVSSIDGYEEAYGYYKLEKNGISVKQITKLMKSEPKQTENALGKIVGQHIWYFVCNMSETEASKLKTNGTVSVDFPDKGVHDVAMTVKSIERSGDTAAVIFKCALMNEELLTLRKEAAVISVNSSTGFKISNEAIVSGDGDVGVYVHSGNLVVFKPIKILFRSDSYVIAVAPEKDKEGEDIPSAKVLKQYDKVIVKGRHLYDGKVIG